LPTQRPQLPQPTPRNWPTRQRIKTRNLDPLNKTNNSFHPPRANSMCAQKGDRLF
jgi:hypothetical protein